MKKKKKKKFEGGKGMLEQISSSKSSTYEPLTVESLTKLLKTLEVPKEKEFQMWTTGIAGVRAFNEAMKEEGKKLNPKYRFIQEVLKTDWSFDIPESERENLAGMAFDIFDGQISGEAPEWMNELHPTYMKTRIDDTKGRVMLKSRGYGKTLAMQDYIKDYYNK